jgi:ADP-ribose pyrophosphatase
VQTNFQDKAHEMPELESWRTLKRNLLLDRSPWMRVYADDVELPDGRIVKGYLRLESPSYVMIVPVDRKKQIGLVRSYKRGVDAIDIQPPAGIIEVDEPPLEAARRELLEELGCTADQWQALGSYVLGGNFGGGPAHIFLATGCEQIQPPDSGDLEEQQVLWLPQIEAERQWMAGTFQQLGSVAALGLAFAHLGHISSGVNVPSNEDDK